jgi:DNA-binding NtrC family response regulator
MSKQESKVLIVDDFGDTGKILVQMFDHLNVKTESVSNPEQAFSKVSENSYKLVIADSRMPKLDGVSLLKQIRKSSPSTKVVVMSTFDSGHTLKLVAADGIDYYLPKPVKLQHLEQMLTELALKL